MPVTKEQAELLATLAVACRPHGARRWEAPGIVAAIAKVKHLSLADVAMAVIRGAGDRNAETPGVIAATTGQAWTEKVTEPSTRRTDWPDDAHRCRTCSLSPADHERVWADDHPFEAAASVTRLPADQAHAVVGELRDHAASDPPPRPAPEVGTEGTTRVQPVRAAIAARKEDSA